jgi:hypothetical protein
MDEGPPGFGTGRKRRSANITEIKFKAAFPKAEVLGKPQRWGEMMKKFWRLMAAALLLTGCNNFFHELVPPDGNRILSFRVANQMGETEIGEDRLTAVAGPGTDIRSLIPEIQISSRASLLPLTLDYIAAAFPSVNLFRAAVGIRAADDLAAYVIDLIKANPGFNVPALDKPIDFTGPVDFLVIGGLGSIRRYTAHVALDTGAAKLLGFGFAKYDNPELIGDAFAVVNGNSKTILAYVKYPAEYTLSFALVPGFELLGDRLIVEGAEIRSGLDSIQFDASYGLQSKAVRVERDGCPSTEYTLQVMFSEDPDSIRSITDFRFKKSDNPGLVLDAVAAIVNTEDRGTIRAQVLYTGARPVSLIPRFISPGTVSVGGTNQISGTSSHSFAGPLEYLVVSRNGLYSRTYTVQIELVNVSDLMPRFSSFRFSYALNPELTQDTAGEINEGAGRILIDAHYSGLFAPETLVPEFAASGLVKVTGVMQTSGVSGQNFSRQIRYTVVSPDNPALQTEYWVQVRFVQDPGAVAAITAFSFHPDENPVLASAGELAGRIDPGTAQIFVYAPYGISPAALSVPRFSASGRVSAAGLPQTSGLDAQDFSGPALYTVESPNGQNSRTYTVQVMSTARIYVQKTAAGNNNGTSWANAFTSLKAACDYAATLPEAAAKEIWIAGGTYRASETGDRAAFFPISSNASYIGGFAGWETGRTQRNPAANPVIISGDLGGSRSRQLFKNSGTVSGDIVFEDLSFTGAGDGAAVWPTVDSPGISLAVSPTAGISGRAEIRNCTFTDLIAYDVGAVGIFYPAVTVSGMVITDTTSHNGPGGAFLIAWSGTGATVTLSDSLFKNCRAGTRVGAFEIKADDYNRFTNDLGIVEITNTDVINCTAKENYKIGVVEADHISIRGCTFIDEDGAFAYPPYAYADDYPYVVGPLVLARGEFDSDMGIALVEDCVFTNLVNTYAAKRVFAITAARRGDNTETATFDLTVRNTQFNARPDTKLGFIQTRSGFLLDNCRIQYTPTQSPPMPLLVIKNAAYNYQVRANNTYNGVPLDAAAVAAMNANTALVTRLNGAVLTAAP